MKKDLKIALFGCGTVGSGVHELLRTEGARMARATGFNLSVAGICVRDPEKERGVPVPHDIITTDGGPLLDDPDIDIVVELIGGEEEARGIIARALVNGKNVVTANKLVIARHLPYLRRLEELHGGRLFYGASVCGSIPILKVIDETLIADRITHLRGVVNGSTNFILSRLAEGCSDAEALELAGANGFLEADPTADLSGADAAHKLSILAFHAFGRHVPPEAIATTGIEHVTAVQVEAARAAGKTIKLVAQAAETDRGLRLSVGPQLVELNDPLASVRDEMNIVELQCEGVGTQHFSGKGAGSIPTANAVLSDLTDILARRRYQRNHSDRICIPHGTFPDCAPSRAHDRSNTSRTIGV
ncbi:MAG TPA: homoserine dehydrogenase [Candidatus Kapabacteria bacterium]|nr:homoserine dehydrogenase [Candidatus Kapabacteria bacterium]